VPINGIVSGNEFLLGKPRSLSVSTHIGEFVSVLYKCTHMI